MRKQYVWCITGGQARQACPWAAVIVRADGGFMCFESVNDAAVWIEQK